MGQPSFRYFDSFPFSTPTVFRIVAGAGLKPRRLAGQEPRLFRISERHHLL